mmetsp:Transcript_40971/g.68605  ORF Transcript_40971/g.68605 Transcript_40971/m.68605 type:complete len:433 (+) Transcript_40971:105-1403(+)
MGAIFVASLGAALGLLALVIGICLCRCFIKKRTHRHNERSDINAKLFNNSLYTESEEQSPHSPRHHHPNPPQSPLHSQDPLAPSSTVDTQIKTLADPLATEREEPSVCMNIPATTSEPVQLRMQVIGYPSRLQSPLSSPRPSARRSPPLPSPRLSSPRPSSRRSPPCPSPRLSTPGHPDPDTRTQPALPSPTSSPCASLSSYPSANLTPSPYITPSRSRNSSLTPRPVSGGKETSSGYQHSTGATLSPRASRKIQSRRNSNSFSIHSYSSMPGFTPRGTIATPDACYTPEASETAFNPEEFTEIFTAYRNRSPRDGTTESGTHSLPALSIDSDSTLSDSTESESEASPEVSRPSAPDLCTPRLRVLRTASNGKIDLFTRKLEGVKNFEDDGDVWFMLQDTTTGSIYYWNQATQEATWEKPEAFIDATPEAKP